MAKTYPDTIPAEYQSDADLESAYRQGWNHGHGIACHNVPSIGDRVSATVDWCGIGRYVDADNIRDYHQMLCHTAADNARQFSPFEFTARDFNSAETDEDGNWDPDLKGRSDELWEAFEAGTNDAITADLSEYTDEDYGIEPAEQDTDV